MPHRYPVAVHVFLTRGDDVLFLRRANTGYEDGKLSVPAGHVEPGESALEAAVREVREEIGLDLSGEPLEMVGVMHRRSEEERIDFFLSCPLGDRAPRNLEPDKCSELLWAAATDPPPDTIPYVLAGLEAYREGQWYREFGWSEPEARQLTR